jgi:tRNA threonylcarbamoyladenosine biosynthesis protein TsaE
MRFTYKLVGIREAVEMVWKQNRDKKVWAFYADMGAGKTTFIQALCSLLSVHSTVGSPTYSIINEYASSNGAIYHMDWYRLKDEEEALQAGVEDCIYSGRLCFIEWPQKAEALLPADHLNIQISLVDADTREIITS